MTERAWTCPSCGFATREHQGRTCPRCNYRGDWIQPRHHHLYGCPAHRVHAPESPRGSPPCNCAALVDRILAALPPEVLSELDRYSSWSELPPRLAQAVLRAVVESGAAKPVEDAP